MEIPPSNTLHIRYIESLAGRNSPYKDYTSFLLRDTPIFLQETTPRLPFIRTEGSYTYMHYNTRSLLVLLHKLNIRPSL